MREQREKLSNEVYVSIILEKKKNPDTFDIEKYFILNIKMKFLIILKLGQVILPIYQSIR